MPDNKSPISEDDILYIGIPGAKNNLSLNLEWPPGIEPEIQSQDFKERLAPAKFLTDYKLIIANPSNLGVIHMSNNCLNVRRKELMQFLTDGGLLVCIVKKQEHVQNFDSLENAMNYEFINYNVSAPIGGIGGVLITDRGLRSAFVDAFKLSKHFSLYYNEIKDIWGIRNDPSFCPVTINSLVVDQTKTKVVSFEAVPLSKTNKTEPDLRYKSQALSENHRVISGIIWETLLGKMVFLPDYVLQDVKLLVECAKQELMQMGTAGFVPAVWTRHYTFSEHEDFVSEIDSLSIQLNGITKKLQEKEKRLAELELTRNVLLNGQGIILEQIVKQVFNELDIGFIEGPEGRDDLILKDETGKAILVSEVKGVKSSGAEDHATRLNKWCDRVFEEEGHIPNGLLIVNAWREKEPKDRNEAAFPDQMLRYCKKKEFCCMTTVQLFNMWCAFKRGEFKGGEELLNQIIEAKGVFPGFDDPKANRI